MENKVGVKAPTRDKRKKEYGVSTLPEYITLK